MKMECCWQEMNNFVLLRHCIVFKCFSHKSLCLHFKTAKRVFSIHTTSRDSYKQTPLLDSSIVDGLVLFVDSVLTRGIDVSFSIILFFCGVILNLFRLWMHTTWLVAAFSYLQLVDHLLFQWWIELHFSFIRRENSTEEDDSVESKSQVNDNEDEVDSFHVYFYLCTRHLYFVYGFFFRFLGVGRNNRKVILGVQKLILEPKRNWSRHYKI
jgi:hypothetical protein